MENYPVSPFLHKRVPAEFSNDTWGKNETLVLIPHRISPVAVIVFLSWFMLMKNNGITPATSQHYI
jgi:hypothetical protein